MNTSKYVPVRCVKCGWRDGLREDLVGDNMTIYCDQCNETQPCERIMTDTPRTDAAEHNLYSRGVDRHWSGVSMAQFARELERENRGLLAKNSDLHRRCQQSESAVTEVKKDWDKHGGPRGGSFGRALLACECDRLERENQQLRADIKLAEDALREIHKHTLDVGSEETAAAYLERLRKLKQSLASTQRTAK